MKYRVTFLTDSHDSIKYMIVLAANAKQAMNIAWNMYHVKGWTFGFSDMIAEEV